ncbi:MAG: polyketide cyclase [Prevotellaceae bacterium]|jgi:carbon monoxide dehydrogenase subunit G|nr:polyketide cyclase [Prevotellaceae bacterium]
MKKYISKTVKVNRMLEEIFNFLSDMSLFSQAIPKDKIEDWQATPDECSFKVKGMHMGVKIIDRDPFKTIKFTGNGAVPAEFFLWIQLKEVAPYDIRMRMVLHVKLNMIMKLLLKGKIQNGLDQMAEQIANAFNGVASTPPSNLE